MIAQHITSLNFQPTVILTQSKPARRDRDSTINKLPPEILLKIYSYLPETDLNACQLVCQKWNSTISNAQLLWKQLVQVKQAAQPAWKTVHQNYASTYGFIENYRLFLLSTRKFLRQVERNWESRDSHESWKLEVNGYGAEQPIFTVIVEDSIFILKRKLLLEYDPFGRKLKAVYDLKLGDLDMLNPLNNSNISWVKTDASTIFYLPCIIHSKLTIFSLSIEPANELVKVQQIYRNDDSQLFWSAIAFSRTHFAAGATNGTLVVFNMKHKQTVALLTEFGEYDAFSNEAPWNEVFLNYINSVAISEDYLLVGTGGSKEIHVWRIEDELTFRLRSSINARHIQYSGIQDLRICGDKILLLSYENFSVWSISSFRCLLSKCLVENDNTILFFDEKRLVLQTACDLRCYIFSWSTCKYETFPTDSVEIKKKWRLENVFSEDANARAVCDHFQVISYNNDVLSGVSFAKVLRYEI